MLKSRKHIKQSKGERLAWISVSSEKASAVYRSSLDGRFLKPVRVSEEQGNTMPINANNKLLVP